uniref:Uncharacterized protein LOC102805146 n=1 Tax=Saccoglossus kowalevskii TaxID=10224 RepID=A0ABM0MWG3_SACKO|nr:PREDICTED: uncharacterized protein LOC102805146 [Saccoglossus kowalevskii]
MDSSSTELDPLAEFIEDIGGNIRGDELDQMKRLSVPLLSQNKIEKCNSAAGLLTALAENGKISTNNMDNLISMLQLAKRQDLVEEVERFVGERNKNEKQRRISTISSNTKSQKGRSCYFRLDMNIKKNMLAKYHDLLVKAFENQMKIIMKGGNHKKLSQIRQVIFELQQQIEKIEEGSIILIVRCFSVGGVISLTHALVFGELEEKMTQLLITDEMKAILAKEDVDQNIRISVTMDLRHLKWAKTFFEGLEAERVCHADTRTRIRKGQMYECLDLEVQDRRSTDTYIQLNSKPREMPTEADRKIEELQEKIEMKNELINRLTTNVYLIRNTINRLLHEYDDFDPKTQIQVLKLIATISNFPVVGKDTAEKKEILHGKGTDETQGKISDDNEDGEYKEYGELSDQSSYDTSKGKGTDEIQGKISGKDIKAKEETLGGEQKLSCNCCSRLFMLEFIIDIVKIDLTRFFQTGNLLCGDVLYDLYMDTAEKEETSSEDNEDEEYKEYGEFSDQSSSDTRKGTKPKAKSSVSLVKQKMPKKGDDFVAECLARLPDYNAIRLSSGSIDGDDWMSAIVAYLLIECVQLVEDFIQNILYPLKSKNTWRAERHFSMSESVTPSTSRDVLHSESDSNSDDDDIDVFIEQLGMALSYESLERMKRLAVRKRPDLECLRKYFPDAAVFLFTLSDEGLISENNFRFLYKLLKGAGREDLIEKVKTFKEKGRTKIRKDKHPFTDIPVPIGLSRATIRDQALYFALMKEFNIEMTQITSSDASQEDKIRKKKEALRQLKTNLELIQI